MACSGEVESMTTDNFRFDTFPALVKQKCGGVESEYALHVGIARPGCATEHSISILQAISPFSKSRYQKGKES
jgi:hypothetical protein